MQPNTGRIGAQHPNVGGHPIQQSQPQPQIPSFPQFPQCANDVLHQLSEFVKQRGQNANYKWNRKMLKDLQDLIDNNLFCLAPDTRISRLNPLHHLKLLGIVCTYFQRQVSKEPDPQLRYLHFDLIFCGREGETRLHQARIKFLIQVCSLATQFPVYSFFEHVAQWLSKVSSDELKRSYAKQIVDELMEGFVLAPKENKLYEYLVPLAAHSFEFCANFVIFSITDDSMGPILAFLIGEWVAPNVEQFIHCLSQMTHLGHPFCAEKFNILLGYDCSEKATDGENDEVHHKLHCAMTEIPIRWKQIFEPHAQKPRVDCLFDAFQRIDSLSFLSQKHLLENMLGCFRADFLPRQSIEQFRLKFILDAKHLVGPLGTLWQSLASFTFPIANTFQ